ncbi:hypothetical protein LDR46_004383 [Salmonella enterica]|nr:hypothetical protein [Salmonella enterica]
MGAKTRSVVLFLLAFFLFSHAASAGLYEETMTAYHAQAQNSPATSANDLMGPSSDPVTLMNAALGDALAQMDKTLAALELDKSPLTILQQVGNIALDAADVMLAKVTMMKMAQARELMGPFYTVAGWVLLDVGFLLGICLPLIPFIAFVGGAMFWLVSVVVGSTMAPVYAFFWISGDESTRKRYGEVLFTTLVDAGLRPSIMVLGFVASGLMVVGLLKLVLMFMLPMIFNALPVSFVGIWIKILLLLGLARLCVIVVALVFNNIITLPDAVLKFLGMSVKRIRMDKAW